MKKIVSLIVIAAFAVTAGLTLKVSNKENVADLLMSNVEALGRYELNPECLNGCHVGPRTCYCYESIPWAREHVWN